MKWRLKNRNDEVKMRAFIAVNANDAEVSSK